MKKQSTILAASIYIAFLFIGPHGPFAANHHGEDHPHTHKRHIVKLVRIEEHMDKRLTERKYIPVSS